MPIPFLLLLASPTLLGLLLGIGIWLSLRKQAVQPERPVRIAVGLAAVVLVVPILFALLLLLFPFSLGQIFSFRSEWRFLLPLALGVIALVILIFPIRRRQGVGKAQQERRTPLSFAGSGSLWMLVGLTVVSVGAALFGGFLSRPDEAGNYTMFWVELGGTSAGTTIYGWYYSIPALATIAAILVLVAVNLVLVSRPPLFDNAAADIEVRKLRVRASLWLASGAIALHLAEVFTSLAATSTLRLSAGSVRDVAPVSTGTSFAATTSVLWVAWAVATVIAVSLCVSVLLSIMPVRARSRVTA